ncbi:MAG: uL13 family ribosomal protein, partial [Desulfoplanes sp.]|nr:uL13 family ribosomal protein [Desulfoplanes sp.]
SGYVGGLTETTLGTLLGSKPERVLEHAVQGMLHKNALGRAIIKKLKVYARPEHPHAAQIATILDI